MWRRGQRKLSEVDLEVLTEMLERKKELQEEMKRYTVTALAEKFDCSHQSISYIANGRRRKR